MKKTFSALTLLTLSHVAQAQNPFDYLPPNTMPDLKDPAIAATLERAENMGYMKQLVQEDPVRCEEMAAVFNKIEQSTQDFVNNRITPDLSGTPEQGMTHLITWLVDWKNSDQYSHYNFDTRPQAKNILSKECGATFTELPSTEGTATRKLGTILKLEKATLP